MRRYSTVLMCCAALCLPIAACDKPADDTAAAADTVATNAAARSDTTFTETPREVLPSDRIYFNLTQHEWYAKGTPLVHAGRSYMPAGFPIAASLPEMERVGEYQGVEYYRRADSDSILFVPVSRGYWQVFRGAPAQR